MTQTDIPHAEPVYEELPGWLEDISGAREFDELPANARAYVLRLEELAGAHVSCIGVGPGPGPDHRAPRRPGGRARDGSATRTRPRIRPARRLPEVRARPARARASAGSSTAMRRVQDLAVSADPGPATPGTTAADRAEELVELLDPFEAAEGVGPANRVPSLPGAGSLLMPPYHVDEVRGRRRRVDRAVQPVSRRRQPRRARRRAAAAVRLTCSAWSSTPPAARSAAPPSCTSTTARSHRSTRR